jgi:YbgC/YbaW family acyl-CoA thioester hydrolase
MNADFKLPFTCLRRIEFSETDAAGLFHFSGYFRLMEFAEAAFVRQLGWPLLEQRQNSAFGFPRIHAKAKFIRPLKFEDEVDIQLSINSLELSRIHYSFRFEKEKNCVARGEMSVVYVEKNSEDAALSPTHLPADLKKILQDLINRT